MGANEEVLRLRTTFVSDESLARIRQMGREIGINLPAHGRKGAKELETGFKAITESVKKFGEQVLKAVPALEEWGLGAAGAGVAAGVLITTLTKLSGKIVELSYASKELGLSEREIRAWTATAAKAGIAPEAMIGGLKNFAKTMNEFKYNMGSGFDELMQRGLSPVVARLKGAANESDKLKVAFDFKEVLMKSDPSGYKARWFFDQIGLGADAARLSLEDYKKTHAHLMPVSPEDEKRAKDFHDAMIELGEAWENLAQRTAIKLFPWLTDTIKDIQELGTLLEGLVAKIPHVPDNVPIPNMLKAVPGPIGAAAMMFDWLSQHHASRRAHEQGAAAGHGAPQHRAAGGPVYRGSAYVVGERGSELMVPDGSGSIIPHGGGGTGGGGGIAEFTKAIKDGVFAALVDFKSYVETGAAISRSGGGGFSMASFGGSAGAAGGGGYSGSGSRGSGSRGSRDDGGTPDAEVPEGNEVNANLAKDRERFRAELKAKPWLRDKLLGLAAGENKNPTANQAVLEETMNRASVAGTSLEQEARSTREGGYYEGNDPGALRNPKFRAASEARLEAALRGSNVSKYATDNSSGGLAQRTLRNGRFIRQFGAGGETFWSPGTAGNFSRRKWMAWRNRMAGGQVDPPNGQERGAAATATHAKVASNSPDVPIASDGIGRYGVPMGMPTPERLRAQGERFWKEQHSGNASEQQIRDFANKDPWSRVDRTLPTGPAAPVTGDVKVLIHHNGTAANAKVDASGIWQKSQTTHFKRPQMNPTEMSAAHGANRELVMQIRDIHNPWRDKYQQAMFRSAMFYVDTDVRAGGRRVALHQYPKRNVPYAEDMGRSANAFQIQAHLIGPVYLDLKNNLIDALEQDGPGVLRLPMPYKGADVKVMVQNYTVTESREKGGICVVEMSFVEYGDPSFRQSPASQDQVAQSAANVESSVMGPPTPDTAAETKPYSDLHSVSGVVN